MFNVVIVEDEQIEREVLKLVLSRDVEGLSIQEASTGMEAMHIIDTSDDIDLILVDINIPHPNGVEVMRYLRQKHKDTKVIITTANDDFDIARMMIGLKADEYLLKPIRPQTLVNTVKSCLHIDLERSKRVKVLVSQMKDLIEQNLYPQWRDMTRQYLANACSQVNAYSDQMVTEFVQALMQIAKVDDLDDSTLKTNYQNLEGVVASKQNYYTLLNQLTHVADFIFNKAQQRLGRKRDSVQKALYFIECSLNKPVTLNEVADQAHVSACYLSRLFKKTVDTSFVSYLVQRRMQIAKDLLELTDLPIHFIALELSYNDANYFCRIFKKELGISPSEYRKRY